MNGLTHTDLILLAFLAIYVSFNVFSLLRSGSPSNFSFILHDHWGDSAGMALITLGVGIEIAAPLLFHDSIVITGLNKTGDGLIGAGLMAMKLKASPVSLEVQKKE